LKKEIRKPQYEAIKIQLNNGIEQKILFFLVTLGCVLF